MTRGRGADMPADGLDRALGVQFHDAQLRDGGADAPLLRVRTRARRDQRAARVPGRRGARASSSPTSRSGAFPDLPEGELAKLRAAIVNMTSLADVARELDLGSVLLLGKGEEQSGGRDKESILADAMEAVLGAVYLDRGLEVARRADRPAVPAAHGGLRARRGRPRLQDHLQELAVAGGQALPDYRIAARGPDHEKEFTATVFLGGSEWGTGTGRSKKEAEQQAAREAYARSRPASARARTGGELGGAARGRGHAARSGEGRRRPAHQGGRGPPVEERDARDPPARTSARSSRPCSRADKITKVERKGKYLLLHLDDGDVLVVHFGMSGQFLRATKRMPVAAAHARACITFQQGGDLRFVDPRTFGEMFVTPADELGKVKELQHIAIDPLGPRFTWPSFQMQLAERAAKMKPLLMDQKFISGLGNIYSDEVLFAAGLRYDRMSDTLSSQEVRRLYRAIQEILQDAIQYRGTTLPTRRTSTCSASPVSTRTSSRSTGARACPAGAAARRSRSFGSPGAVVLLSPVPVLTPPAR